MRIWHISDTHTFHYSLTVPEKIDMVIFSGDCSNPYQLFLNEIEVRDFLKWFSELTIQYKVMIAGNHDSSIEQKRVLKSEIESLGIIYLENESIEIEGIKIWGSPYTPTFGSWAFMKSRGNLYKLWSHIPIDTDIVVVHGPPKGILDLSYNRDNSLEFCGCKALFTVIKKIQPKYVLFGHIHNVKDIINAGLRVVDQIDTIFSNGSVVEDGNFGGTISNGNIIEYKR